MKKQNTHTKRKRIFIKTFARKFAHMFQLPLQMESILHKVVKLTVAPLDASIGI